MSCVNELWCWPSSKDGPLDFLLEAKDYKKSQKQNLIRHVENLRFENGIEAKQCGFQLDLVDELLGSGSGIAQVASDAGSAGNESFGGFDDEPSEDMISDDPETGETTSKKQDDQVEAAAGSSRTAGAAEVDSSDEEGVYPGYT